MKIKNRTACPTIICIAYLQPIFLYNPATLPPQMPIYGQGLTTPRHLAFHSDHIFVVEHSTKEVWCFKSGQEQPHKRITGAFTAPNGIAFTESGEMLVADFSQGEIIKLTEGKDSQAMIRNLKNPYGITMDADKHHILVAESGNESVKAFCSNDYSLKKEFKMGFSPVDIAIQSNGSLAVLSYHGDLAILDPETGDIRHHHKIASEYKGTIGIAVDADDRIYVTQHLNKQVIVFDQKLNFLGPVQGLPDLTAAWGIKAVGGGKQVTLYVAEQGRVSTFPAEVCIQFQSAAK